MTPDEINTTYRREAKRLSNKILALAVQEVTDDTMLGSSIVLGALFATVTAVLEAGYQGELRQNMLEHFFEETRRRLRRSDAVEKLKTDAGADR